MAFTLPTFNLAVNIWRNANPTTNPPDVVAIGNLAYGERNSVPYAVTTSNTTVYGGMWLLIPTGTDIRDNKDPVGPDTVEVPAGTGRFYDVVWVDDAGAGFPNQHRFALLISAGPWPVPFPSPAPPPPPASVVPIQDGAFYLQSSPLTINFTANPGVMMLVISGVWPSGGIFTVTSAALGFLPPQMAMTGPSIPSVTGTTDVILWTHPGGADTLTVTFAGTPSIMFELVQEPYINLDTSNAGNNTPANPFSFNNGSPTNYAPELGVTAVLSANDSRPSMWSAPWVEFFPGEEFVLDYLGGQWVLKVAFQSVPLIGSSIGGVVTSPSVLSLQSNWSCYTLR